MQSLPRRSSFAMPVCALLAPFFVCFAQPIASAHNDDPKVYDTLPPYDGPGIRGGAQAAAAGLAPAVEFASRRVDLLSWLTIPELGLATIGANDCWGYVSPSGREYAIIGLFHGTSFVDITDPENPLVVGAISGTDSLWRDVKVYQQYAYAVAENFLPAGAEGLAQAGGAIQVIDMGSIDDGIVTLRTSISEGGVTSTHNVVINEESGYLYRLGGGNNHGLRIYNLANPAQPTYVGAWMDRYVHDAQVVTYQEGIYAGREIAFCCSGFGGGATQTGLDIVDVTDKTNIVNLARLEYPFGAYSHQGWLSEDRRYFYLNDEADQNFGLKSTIHVIDVSDLLNPVYVNSFTNDNPAITHNIYVRDGLLFEANYTSGVRIFDVAADPTVGHEIGYFDTRPESDAVSFNGAWSVYSFFPSGNIIVSDRERGLFVLRPDLGRLFFSYPQGLPDTVAIDQGATIQVHIEPGAVPIDAATVFISIADTGQGPAMIPMDDLGGNDFQGVLPGMACGESIDYSIIAENADGQRYADPTPESGEFHRIAADSCSDGVFCNGVEQCVDGECIAGVLPCLPALCDEAGAQCLPCTNAAQCDDGVFCNGAEVCVDGDCDFGAAVCAGRQCDEAADVCFDCLTAADCNDGIFCNGPEACVNRACVDSTAPCGGGMCDESADQCVDCFADVHCDDGLYCTGAETCIGGDCVSGALPCAGACDEAADTCVNATATCVSASDCDDADDCTIDACNNATCSNVADPDCDAADQDDDAESPSNADDDAGDDDGDGVDNAIDRCAGTPDGATVNAVGCSCHNFDDDGDGVMNCFDLCAESRAGMTVDEFGCTRIETPEADDETDDDVVVDNRPIPGAGGDDATGGASGGDGSPGGDDQEAGAALPGELNEGSESTSNEVGANGSGAGAGSAGSNRAANRSVCGAIGLLPTAALLLGVGLVRRSRRMRRS